MALFAFYKYFFPRYPQLLLFSLPFDTPQKPLLHTDIPALPPLHIQQDLSVLLSLHTLLHNPPFPPVAGEHPQPVITSSL